MVHRRRHNFLCSELLGNVLCSMLLFEVRGCNNLETGSCCRAQASQRRVPSISSYDNRNEGRLFSNCWIIHPTGD